MNVKFWLSFLPGVLAAAAFVVTLFGGVYCKFVSFSPDVEGADDSLNLNFGIWYYQGWAVVQSPTQGTLLMQTCFRYPDGTVFDAKWKSAKAFSTMALIIGGVLAFWSLLAGCFYPTKSMYRAGGMIFMLCSLFTGLSLLMLDSNACLSNSLMTELQELSAVADLVFPASCSMGVGAKCTIAATVMWFVAALAAFVVEPPQRSPITTETHEVTYTKTTGQDGTVVVSEAVKREPPTDGQNVEEGV